jgi:hypothetical protein
MANMFRSTDGASWQTTGIALRHDLPPSLDFRRLIRNAVPGTRVFLTQTQEGVMANASDQRQLQRIPPAEQREASNFTIAVVMAGIFAFFVAGIASAFIYANDTNVAQVTQAPTAGTPAETTGSGGAK